VELSEPPTSEGAITNRPTASPNRIAEVRAVRGTGPPFGQNHHAVRASRHFFRGHRPHVQEGWTVVLEPGNFKRIIARIAPATGKRSAGRVKRERIFRAAALN
jgi:hypothetical protein